MIKWDLLKQWGRKGLKGSFLNKEEVQRYRQLRQDIIRGQCHISTTWHCPRDEQRKQKHKGYESRKQLCMIPKSF